MIDVAAAIDAEAILVTLTTRAAGSYVDGEWVEGGPVAASISAAIFPASGNALKDMPEGIRTEAGWLCWSRSAIAVDDLITNAGIVYRVLFVWPRPEGGFYRAALGRMTP